MSYLAPIHRYSTPYDPSPFGTGRVPEAHPQPTAHSDITATTVTTATRILSAYSGSYNDATQPVVGWQDPSSARSSQGGSAYQTAHVDGMNYVGAEGNRDGLWRTFAGNLVDNQAALHSLDEFSG